jgi:hypothetical protein
MRRAATSLLLTDLLAPSAGSSEHGSVSAAATRGNGAAGFGIPKSQSATGLAGMSDGGPSGLELLKASVRQYLEVREKSVHGGKSASGSRAGQVPHGSLQNGSVHSAKLLPGKPTGATGNDSGSVGLSGRLESVEASMSSSRDAHAAALRALNSTQLYGDGGGSFRVVRRSEDNSFRSGSYHSGGSQGGSGRPLSGESKRKVLALKALE